MQTYAGQVTMLDDCLDALLDFFDGLPITRETLLSVTLARGLPLGEHNRLGPCDGALYGELVHVPWMLRLPEARAAAVRSPALVEPADLWATLLDWFGAGSLGCVRDAPQTVGYVHDAPQPVGCVRDAPRLSMSPTANSVMPLLRQETDLMRDRLCLAGSDCEQAIRTPAWYLRSAGEPELFAKPDDRWEVNNVACRCPEVVESLQAALAQYQLTLPTGRIRDLPPLSDVLLRGLG